MLHDIWCWSKAWAFWEQEQCCALATLEIKSNTVTPKETHYWRIYLRPWPCNIQEKLFQTIAEKWGRLSSIKTSHFLATQPQTHIVTSVAEKLRIVVHQNLLHIGNEISDVVRRVTWVGRHSAIISRVKGRWEKPFIILKEEGRHKSPPEFSIEVSVWEQEWGCTLNSLRSPGRSTQYNFLCLTCRSITIQLHIRSWVEEEHCRLTPPNFIVHTISDLVERRRSVVRCVLRPYGNGPMVDDKLMQKISHLDERCFPESHPKVKNKPVNHYP